MALVREFTCPLPNGIHARPASVLEEFVRTFDSDVTLTNARTQRSANGKSVLSIVGVDIRHTDPCLLHISGSDEQQAMDATMVFLRDEFPRCDQPLKTEKKVSGKNGELHLPPCLNRAGADVHRGVVVVSGIAQGRAVHAGKSWNPEALPRNCAVDAEKEWQRVESGLEKLAADCERKIAALGAGIECELLKVHRAIVRDAEFVQQLRDEIIQRGRTAAEALAHVEKHFTSVLMATGNELLCERALDIQDMCGKLARQIYGDAVVGENIKLTADSIVFAEALTPGQFLALDRKFLKGLVLAHASTTSHTAILARSFAIPTLAAVQDFARVNHDNKIVVVDADIGILVTNLTDEARRYYELEDRRIAGRQARLKRMASRDGITRDGHRMGVVANISTANEASVAFECGAEGIGLFRTEMLFLDRQSAPDETEQYNAYRTVLAAAGSKPVVIRTFDIGGDKQPGYLNLPAEENPFLGCRAVRIYAQFQTLFRTQIRALVRASAHGNLRVMIPLLSTVGEARWVKKIISEEQQKCAAENISFNTTMQIGAMIEVPAAAFSMEALGREFDFFSIGSNDLLQYFMAADRMNARLGSLYNPLQPAFLRLLKQIADAAHAQKKEISLCGEIDAQAKILPLLLGLGLDKISVSAPVVAALKTDIAALSFAECRELSEQILRDADDTDGVTACLAEFASRHAPPLVEEELIIVDSDAVTKEEAIKQLVDRMHMLGRAENSRAVEEAVWLRESKYSTGFGYGFAIPHCKDDAVRFNSLVVLKSREPLEWGSLDGQPVRVVILLAIRESGGADAHMKVLTRLARKVMDDEFRAELEQADNPAALISIINKIL